MKPFNLEAAKSGERVVTRNGREAKFLSDNVVGGNQVLLWIVKERSGKDSILYTYREGGFTANKQYNDNDLFMYSEPSYKPFTYETVPLGRVITFSSPNGRMKALIAWANTAGVSFMIGVDAKSVTYDKLLSNYKFDNGEPCGILES